MTDALTDLLRTGAQQLIATAVEAELEGYLAQFTGLHTQAGHAAVVRNGHHPARPFQTGIGPVSVQIPKVRSMDGTSVTFRSALVPPYVRRTKTLEAALPWLYLKGISSGEMGAALKVLLGPDSTGLSANTVSRLKRDWAREYDGWREVLLNLKSRGMNAPKLAIGDGAMGFWRALEEVYPESRQQRCWQHKTMNVLNCLPKLSQPKAKAAIHDIYQAETKDDAQTAFDLFIKTYELKYPKASLCPQKDRQELMAFFDFPAQHWQSIRTSNPIESAFATIRHRTKRSKGCLSRDGMLHMMFKLGQCAEQNWRRLRGFDYLAKVITGVTFKDGIETTKPSQIAA